MPDAGDLTDPVSYATVWTVVAIVLPLLVVGWYAGVTWLTRERGVSSAPMWWRLWRARRSHLRELARIRQARGRGAVSAREAHQAVSATVRSFVAEVTPVDARAMNLEQLRAAAPPQAVAVVELVYPPAFSPGDAEADDKFDTALEDARQLVAGWRG